MMLAMGMTMRVADFERIVSSPRAFAFGIVSQLALLPMLAFAIAWLLALQRDLAVGLVLIAACPGGVTSNAITHYARGDTALSISLTAASSAVSFITVPTIVGIALAAFGTSSTDADIVLPVADTAMTLLVTTALPIALGMLVHHRDARLAARVAGPLLAIATGLLMVMIVGLGASLAVAEENVGRLFRSIALAIGLLIAGLAALGIAGGRALGLPASQRRTVVIELALQNVNLALVIAVTMLDERRLAGAAIVYLPASLAVALAIVLIARRAPPARDVSQDLMPGPAEPAA
jgi:BASS family bile acid:Na+ symporter